MRAPLALLLLLSVSVFLQGIDEERPPTPLLLLLLLLLLGVVCLFRCTYSLKGNLLLS